MATAELKLSEALLAKLAGWAVMKEARSLLAAGRVVESTWQPPRLTGQVRDGASTIRCGLLIRSDTDADNLCPCRTSRQRGLICAHSVAVGLGVLAPPVAPTAPPAVPAPASPASAPGAEPPARPPGRRLRRAVPGSDSAEPLRLSLVLPPSLFQDPPGKTVTVYCEGSRHQGIALLGSLPSPVEFRLSEADLLLLDTLEALGGGDTPSVLSLAPPQLRELFLAAAGHPGITLGRTTRLQIEKVAAPVQVSLRLQETGEIRLTAKPTCSGTRVPLLGNWVRDGAILRPLDIPESLAGLLQTPALVQRDRVPAFLQEDWPSLVSRCLVDADFDPAAIQLEQGVPTFRLRLTGGMAMLDAVLECQYGATQVVPGEHPGAAGAWMADPHDVLRYAMRDPAAEKAALAALVRAGFSPPNTQGRWTLRGEDAVLGFFTRELPALEQAWSVSFEERLSLSMQRNLERLEPTFDIRATGSGEEWFDLGVVYATRSGEALEPAEIQRLLRAGHGRTRLRNGKWALLNTAAAEELEQVFAEAAPRQHAGLFRFAGAQAGFIEASLRAQPAAGLRAPEAWARRAAQLNGQVEVPPPDLGTLSGVLRPYQVQGVAWLHFLRSQRFGGVLADDMGLGKTLQVLAHMDSLRRKQQLCGPCLVVAPTSLVTNWEAEARRFTPNLRVLALQGGARAARFAEINESHLVITSYALARLDSDRYAGLGFDTVILDEAQHIKNPGTQNAQVVKAIRCQHRLVLTGTPIENSVRDLWSIFDFLMPGYLGSARDFRERYELPLARGGDPRTRDRLARRLRPFVLRRLKRDVAADLPARIEQVSLCEMTDAQSTAYRQVLEAGRSEILAVAGQEHLPQNRMLALTLLLRLRQIACDLSLVRPEEPGAPGNKEEVAATSGKLACLLELLEEAQDGGHRVLVFSQFTAMLDIIDAALERRGTRRCRLDGSTRNRADVVERFQKDASIPAFLISLKAGGTGLNLTAADTVVHFDPWWNPAVEAQATDRAHRIGQQRVVTSYKLVARGTVEEKILQLQSRKASLAGSLLGGEESLVSALSWDELTSLLADA